MGSLKRGYAERVLAWPAGPVIICSVLTGTSGADARPQQREKGRTLVNEQHASSEFMTFGGI
jgi:hypothetical protein